MSEEKKPARSLQAVRMGLAEHTRQDHIVNAEVGTTMDDIVNPFYWTNVAPNMQIYDHVEVRDESGEWIANFIVTEVGINFAKVFMTTKYDLTKMEKTTIADAHRVDWRGPQHKFCVIRNADGEVIQKNLPTKEAGVTWMINHEQVVRAT